MRRQSKFCNKDRTFIHDLYQYSIPVDLVVQFATQSSSVFFFFSFADVFSRSQPRTSRCHKATDDIPTLNSIPRHTPSHTSPNSYRLCKSFIPVPTCNLQPAIGSIITSLVAVRPHFPQKSQLKLIGASARNFNSARATIRIALDDARPYNHTITALRTAFCIELSRLAVRNPQS